MKRIIVIILFFGVVITVSAQIDAGSVMGMPSATTAEISGITPVNEGALAYSTDEDVIYVYTSSLGWVKSADDQNISGSNLTGTDLTIGIEGGTSETIDLSSLNDAGTDNQKIDNFSLVTTTLQISLERDAETPRLIDLGATFATDAELAAITNLLVTTIIDSEARDLDTVIGNEYNTAFGISGSNLRITDGGGNLDVPLSSFADHDWYEVGGTTAPDDITDNIYTEGNVGVGVTSPTGKFEARSTSDVNAFVFSQSNITTGEKDVFTIEDEDVGGGGQDESSVLKVIKSGTINTNDLGFSLVELASTGVDPGANKYWISGRTTDEGAVKWGVDITDNDYWSEGGILLGATGADGGTYSGGTFRVEANGDTGIGTIAPSARLDVDGDARIRTLPTAADTDQLVTADTNGNLRKVNSLKASKVFYPPSIAIDASTNGTFTIDLHAQYIAQFGSPVVSSAGTIPTYTAAELDYHVTFADPDVFGNGTSVQNMSVNAAGILSYEVFNQPADFNSLINVVFVVK